MTCRNSALNSALTTIARYASGLEDRQVLSLSHALQAEAPCAPGDPSVTSEQWHQFIGQALAQDLPGVPRARVASVQARLRASAREAPDARRLHAAQRIVQRCQRAADAQAQFIAEHARATGTTEAQALAAFQEHYRAASQDNQARPTQAFEESFRADITRTHLFVDRRSMYAYEQMMRQRHSARGETRATVQRHPVESSAIAEMGYDPSTGRVEVVMRSSPDRVYAYRMAPSDYQAFATSTSLGRYYATRVRGNAQFQYASEAEADAEAEQSRCRTCGQFATATTHRCPPNGSREGLNRDIRQAAHGDATNPGSPMRLPESQMDTIVLAGDHTLRIPRPGLIQSGAYRDGQVTFPVRAGTWNGFTVEGLATARYDTFTGYDVTPVTEPGDSGTDQLRCTCPEYQRRYQCEHVDTVIRASRDALNGSGAATAEEAQAAAAAVTAQVAAEHATATAQAEASAAAWRPFGGAWEDDPTAFQQAYRQARQRVAAWRSAVADGTATDADFPIDYALVNAFGGLATRASGRGIGIELEYSYPPTMDWAERAACNERIGRELYALGLTTRPSQAGYGASHGQYRDQHARGWSFESDPSTDGGGEIVSPVMFDDDPDTWPNVAAVCRVLRENGATPERCAGMHVHVGIGDYDHTVANHSRLLALAHHHQDLLYRLSTEPTRGRHRGMTYCGPHNGSRAPYQTVGAATRWNSGHDRALNLQSVAGEATDHVEFRTFDASLNPAVIQTQIGLAVLMSEAALRPDSIDPLNYEPNPIGSRLDANPSRGALTGDAWHESTRGVRRLIDTIVPGTTANPSENPIALQIVSLFAATKWQRRR